MFKYRLLRVNNYYNINKFIVILCVLLSNETSVYLIGKSSQGYKLFYVYILYAEV